MEFYFYIKLYVSVFVAFLGVDFIWLTKVAPQFYKNNIGHLMADKPFLLPAGLFYVINIAGILVFSVLPGIKANSPITAVLLGALYGLCTYATYDLTNYTTLKDWPLTVVVVDLLWGTFLTSLVALIGYYIGTELI